MLEYIDGKSLSTPLAFLLGCIHIIMWTGFIMDMDIMDQFFNFFYLIHENQQWPHISVNLCD